MSEPIFAGKCVINTCYGGFSLSEEATARLMELGVQPSPNAPEDWQECGNYWLTYDLDRWDPRLVQVVEELGESANGVCSKLKIVEISAYLEIRDHDGKERVRIEGGEFY